MVMDYGSDVCADAGLDCSKTCCHSTRCALYISECTYYAPRNYWELLQGFGLLGSVIIGVPLLIKINTICLLKRFCVRFDEQEGEYVGGFTLCECMFMVLCPCFYFKKRKKQGDEEEENEEEDLELNENEHAQTPKKKKKTSCGRFCAAVFCCKDVDIEPEQTEKEDEKKQLIKKEVQDDLTEEAGDDDVEPNHDMVVEEAEDEEEDRFESKEE